MKHLPLLCLLFLLIAFSFAGKAFAYEGILSYKSDIRIRSDGSLLVTDVIRVNVLQRNILHGIHRDIPLRYRDKDGKHRNLGFHLTGVYRDGQPESYRLTNRGSGKYLSIGSEDHLLSAGEHSYLITYTLRRAVDFGDQADYLHWNATGDGWTFPIQEAVIRVYPPSGATINNHDAATGKKDATYKNFHAATDENGVLTFRTTAVLRSGEGMTIFAAWPKGFIFPPSAISRFSSYIEENFHLFVALVALGFATPLFFIIWWLVGRDPPRGTVIPEFSPPENFSPALAAYVAGQGSGDDTLRRAFCAAIADLAIKGVIKITLHGKDHYALDLIKPRLHLNHLPTTERVLAKCLFAGRTSRFMFSAQKDLRFDIIISGFSNSLKRQSDRVYFSGNESYVLASTVFTLLLSAWLFTAMLYDHILLLQGWSMIIGLLFLNLFYYFLMKAPTARGRRKMDRLEGFKMYMSVAEDGRMDFLNPPPMSPRMFETLLPYAIAFGVEKNWAEKFKKSVPKTVYDTYAPDWFVSELAKTQLPNICLALGAGLQKVLAIAAQLPGQLTTGSVMKKAAMMKVGKRLGGGTGGGW
ncbi:MAG: DUF2207 domain-containing protein [Alphaproteobacteria bacterium]|nr:MAG: DUF2207 domain-containing protein [Alphaproteobacteria bacterium]